MRDRRRGGVRRSGVLMHISSLPSPFGIGDIGPEARRFLELLARNGQSVWQVLPLNPTGVATGSSPYHSLSVFAANPLLISPELLVEEGYLETADLDPRPDSPPDQVDFPAVTVYKDRLLQRAFERFRGLFRDEEYLSFCRHNSSWLDDYALFSACRRRFNERPWHEWPTALRDREAGAIERARQEEDEGFERARFEQFLFFRQWTVLVERARALGVTMFGDMPIYPTLDSADLWAHPDIFRLGEDKLPVAVAGVPPDYFSATGQLWGNPVYDWKVLQQRRFDWWIRRLEHNLRFFDLVRIDHFRGLVAYWEVPAGEKTSINGRWVDVPAGDFFSAITGKIPAAALVAEDLGTITPDVTEIRQRFNLPGMKILLFAFGDDDPGNPYLPHNYGENSVAYTGTHDNNTTRGWFEEELSPADRERLFRYIGRTLTGEELPVELIRLAMISPARTVIFPAQDVLCLGSDARMNRPSSSRGNWGWRLDSHLLDDSRWSSLGEMTALYGRTVEPPSAIRP